MRSKMVNMSGILGNSSFGIRHGECHTFESKKLLFALHTARVAGERTIAPDDTMAWYEDAQRIAAYGSSNSSCGLW